MSLQFVEDPQDTVHENLGVLGLTSALDDSDAKGQINSEKIMSLLCLFPILCSPSRHVSCSEARNSVLSVTSAVNSQKLSYLWQCFDSSLLSIYI